MGRTCKHEGCGAQVKARGMCRAHYDKWRRSTTIAKLEVNTRETVLAALPASTATLRKKLGVQRGAAMHWIRKLRDEIHIVRWEKPEYQGPFMPVYARGKGPDAPCTLEHVSKTEQKRRYVAKHPEKMRKVNKANWLRRKATKKQNTWFGALA